MLTRCDIQKEGAEMSAKLLFGRKKSTRNERSSISRGGGIDQEFIYSLVHEERDARRSERSASDLTSYSRKSQRLRTPIGSNLPQKRVSTLIPPQKLKVGEKNYSLIGVFDTMAKAKNAAATSNAIASSDTKKRGVYLKKTIIRVFGRNKKNYCTYKNYEWS